MPHINSVRSALLVTALAVLGGQAAYAETPAGLLSGYTVTSWTLADGIPIGPVWAIVQDAEGYLWLGTSRGLVRFDGARFTPWEDIHTTRLPHPDVQALSLAPDGTLWAGFGRVASGVSVAALRNGQIVRVDAGAAPREATTAVVADRGGRVWAVSDGALHQLRGGRWEVVRADPLGDAVVVSAREDARGALWVGTRDGLFRTRDGERFELIEPGIARDSSAGAGGALWITDPSHGVRRRGPHPGPTGVDGRGMRLLHDARDNLWVATTGQGLWRVHDTATSAPPLVERLTTQTGLSSNVVQSLLEDREGNIWAGTMLGLHSLTRQQLTPLAADALVRAILPEADGSVWVATANGLMQFRRDGGTWRGQRVEAGGNIQSLVRDARGRAWAGTDDGLRGFVHGRLVPAPSGADVAPPCSAGAMMGRTSEVSGQFDLRRVIALNTAQESATVLRPLCGTRDALWAAASGDTLTVRRGEHLVASIRLPSPPAIVTQRGVDTLFEDAAGTMWVGSTAGLWRIRDGKAEQLGEREGLPVQRVMAITQSSDGYLWLAADRGPLEPGRRAALVRLHPSAIDRRPDASTPSAGYQIFDALDGLTGVALGTASAARSTDGSLWFVIGGSLTVVDPGQVTREPQRDVPAQIIAATIDNRPVHPARIAALPAGTRTVQIDYTALRLTTPGRIRFRYRLDGFDGEWIDAGARRQAYYTNLAPGSYRFRVQANSDGVTWTEPEAQWPFAVQPAFHQTGWFYALCATAVLLVTWGVAHTRVWLLNRQFAVMLAERTRLSRELHDTMLQSLAGIALQVQAIARQSLPQASEQRSRLLALRREVEEYMREARQAIQNLRSPMLKARGLTGALTEIGRRVVAPPTRFAISAGPMAGLSPAVEGELLRIGQEAITNAARHAAATHIHVDLGQEADTVRLRVTDDGHGFDVAATTQGEDGHYGLLGMHERAERLGGRVTITSASGGTVVEANVPCVRQAQ